MRFKYNEREDATAVNFKIDTFNDAIDSIADTEGVTVLAHPEFRDMIHESHFWQDAIHPTPAGARILGESFIQEIWRLTRTQSSPPRNRPAKSTRDRLGSAEEKQSSTPSARDDAHDNARDGAHGGALNNARDDARERARDGVRRSARGSSRIGARGGARSNVRGGARGSRSDNARGGMNNNVRGGARGVRSDNTRGGARSNVRDGARSDRRDNALGGSHSSARGGARVNARDTSYNEPAGRLKKCEFPECNVPKNPKQSARHHFYKWHLPSFVSHGDGIQCMFLWAGYFRRLLDSFKLKTVKELHDRVLAEGWSPINRGVHSMGKPCGGDQRMIDAFAEYLHLPHPTSYAETAPCSPALLIQWRILRCILLHGLSTRQRRDLNAFSKRPTKNRNYRLI